MSQTNTQLIIGMGESGMALTRYAVRSGQSVAVYDTRSEPPQLAVLREAYPDVVTHCGRFDEAMWAGVTEMVVSPGLSPHHAPLKGLMEAAEQRQIAVLGELDVFMRALGHLKEQRDYTPKVLAVTGTNGKTTVTAMTRHLCLAAGVSAVAAGNISPSMLDALCDALEADELPQVWVLELSSFQLQLTRGFNPDAATVLNISQDHLDWHSDAADYSAAKARIFGADTVRIVNRDDAAVMAMRGDASAEKCLSFGVDAPQHHQDLGLVEDSGMAWLVQCVAEESTTVAVKARSKTAPTAAETNLKIQRLMPADALRIRGRHNAMNALAALGLCRAIGLPMAGLLHGARDYAGEPHRVQWLAQIDGIDFYDDSKGTNVGATQAAIMGLGQTMVLIAGGDGKGQDFSPLCAAVSAHVRQVCLIGKDAPAIARAWQSTGVAMEIYPDLTAATMAAAQAAQAGDAVLLSPACASLDMFKNYAHRAEVFCAAVDEWAQARGQMR